MAHQSGKSFCWDLTVTLLTCPLAESYIDRAALEAGAAVEMAATHKEEKFVDLGARYIFEPIPAVWRQFPGVFNASARHLLDDLGKISENSGEAHVLHYCNIVSLFQRFDVVGWVIRPAKTLSPKWTQMCRVER